MNAMMTTIVAKEWRLAVRSGRVWPLLAAWVLLSVLAVTGALSAQQRAQGERASAAAADQRAWEGQGARNPHSAAHFGQYAYKPATPLAALDPGLDAWLGASIWMEAHYQNPAVQRAAEDLTPLSRMGTLSLGWMLQVLLPLTILVLGYDLLADDRSRGAIRLQRVAGASALQLMLGKACALLTTTLCVTAPALLAAVFVGAMFDSTSLPDAGARLSLWLGTYAAFGAMWLLITLAVSGIASSARASLATLAGVWLISVLLLPRLAAEHAESAHSSPDPVAFWADIRAAQTEGIDGHNPRDVRTQALEQQVLEQYGVAKLEDLPISFAGISLQAGEEYSNGVFDHFMGSLWDSYASQAAMLRAYSWLAPVLAARDIATHASGTDVVHHRHFATAAETHRRVLQRYLNADMTEHAKGQDFDYLASESLWRDAPRFAYEPPRVLSAGSANAPLLLWLTIGFVGCIVAGRRLDQGASA
jgi:ABC-2 type transport system permease protein